MVRSNTKFQHICVAGLLSPRRRRRFRRRRHRDGVVRSRHLERRRQCPKVNRVFQRLDAGEREFVCVLFRADHVARLEDQRIAVEDTRVAVHRRALSASPDAGGFFPRCYGIPEGLLRLDGDARDGSSERRAKAKAKK